MEACFHSGESSGCHNHGPLRGDSDVQNCSSIRHFFQSQSATPSQIEQRRDDEGDARGVPLTPSSARQRQASNFSLGVASPPPVLKSQNIPSKGLRSGLRYVRVRYKSMDVRTGPQIFEPKPSRFALCESLLS
jgi:hypothetical protein